MVVDVFYIISVLTFARICFVVLGNEDRDSTSKRGVFDPTPFPPGVGGGRVPGDANSQSYEIITSDRAIDESNVGNRMLRNMGWQEGLVSFLTPHFPRYYLHMLLIPKKKKILYRYINI